jgi:hypothetical protein
MTFTIHGMERWSFQIVLMGQRVILEGFHQNRRVCTDLNPLESRIKQAYELVDQTATYA